MVELVDTQDLESCEETRAGSIPVIRTRIMKMPPKIGLYQYNNLEGFLFQIDILKN